MNKRCIVMFSGGLDSLLSIKIMQEQKFKIIALFFRLPFGEAGVNEKDSISFLKKQDIKYKVFDCTKGKLLQEYLKIIKKAKHGKGKGVNPCIDCRIFLLKKAKKFAYKNKIELIVTGEVLGERPMSQMKKAIELIENESGLMGRLLRPLSAKLLLPTNAEKNKLVNREKLYGIQGRRREKQISLAKKFKIKYPDPAGGCLLCEKGLKKRFKYLLDQGINDDEIKLVGIGRHFVIDDCWVVLGKNEKENEIIEEVGRNEKLIVPDFPGPSAIILKKYNEKVNQKTEELIKAFSKKGLLKDREKFEKYKL
jgi:tRNA-uridine 2-sulfurtransferase